MSITNVRTPAGGLFAGPVELTVDRVADRVDVDAALRWFADRAGADVRPLEPVARATLIPSQTAREHRLARPSVSRRTGTNLPQGTMPALIDGALGLP
ncbi:MAG TPA: hypothetical protein VH419_04220 [Nocardioidaceae bacterium]